MADQVVFALEGVSSRVASGGLVFAVADQPLALFANDGVVSLDIAVLCGGGQAGERAGKSKRRNERSS